MVLENVESLVNGTVSVDIEGIGKYTIEGNGATVRNLINIAGAALTDQIFEANPADWDVGFRSSDQTIVVLRHKAKP